MRSPQKIRVRALRRFAQEMCYCPTEDKYAARTGEIEKARRERLRALISEIDAHPHHEFTPEEVARLAWKYYETVEWVQVVIETRGERQCRALRPDPDTELLNERELMRLCRCGEGRRQELRQFIAERFPSHGRTTFHRSRDGTPCRPWRAFTRAEAEEIAAAWHADGRCRRQRRTTPDEDQP